MKLSVPLYDGIVITMPPQQFVDRIIDLTGVLRGLIMQAKTSLNEIARISAVNTIVIIARDIKCYADFLLAQKPRTIDRWDVNTFIAYNRLGEIYSDLAEWSVTLADVANNLPEDWRWLMRRFWSDDSARIFSILRDREHLV